MVKVLRSRHGIDERGGNSWVIGEMGNVRSAMGLGDYAIFILALPIFHATLSRHVQMEVLFATIGISRDSKKNRHVQNEPRNPLRLSGPG